MDGREDPSAADARETAEATVLMATIGLVVGVVIGASGPIFVVVMSPFFGGGPTWGGLALMAGVLIVLVFGLPALCTRRGRWLTVPAFAFGAMLAIGVLAGTRVGSALGTGGWG
ncbi:MAG: hypothetical protein AB1627_08675 [Chloroflexota bacterium]